MPVELCPVAIRVSGKGVRRGKGAGSGFQKGFVPYGGKGGKGDGKNGGGAGHVALPGAPLAVPSPFNRTNLHVSVGDSTQPSHVEMTFEMPGSVVVPPSLAVWGDPDTDPGRAEGVSALHIDLSTTDHPGSLVVSIAMEGAGENETEHLSDWHKSSPPIYDLADNLLHSPRIKNCALAFIYPSFHGIHNRNI